MKNFLYKTLLICAPWIMLSSCDQMVSNVDVPDYHPKLVVFSYISPSDTIVTVVVKKSKAVFGTHTTDPETVTVSNATVVISDGQNSINLPYFENYHGEYTPAYIISQKDFPVVAGRTYHLHVTAPGGFDVTSECTVPDVPDNEVLITHIDSVQSFEEWDYQVGFEVKDRPGQTNYYRIFSDYKYIDPFTGQPSYNDIQLEIGDYFFRGNGEAGHSFSFLTKYFPVQNIGEDNFYVTLMATDENYYTFHKESELAGSGKNGPFQEPVILVSNIEGGLGLFAAYNRRIYSFLLKK